MKKIRIYLVLLVLSLFICLPFLRPGFFPTHDGEWAVVRLGAMHRALLDHQFPVRWASNQNFTYGYPLFEFTYPLPYYFAEGFNIAKIGLVNSIKVVFVLSVILSALGMFIFLRELFPDGGALIGSIFYIFAPYRMVNLYVRGSIGESLSLALFPFLFFTLWKLFKTGENKYITFFSFLFGALLLTHNITSLVFTPFLIAFSGFLLWQEKNKEKVIKKILLALSLGLLISSFFLVPALLEKKYIVLSQTKISDITRHFVSIQNFVIPSWNYGAYSTSDSFSPQLGIAHIVAFLFSLILILRGKNKLLKNLGIFCLASIIVLIFLMNSISLPFWRSAPLFSDIDFPWRLLTPSIFFLSIPVAALGNKKILGLVFVILVILFNFKYANPKSYIFAQDSYYFTNQATTTSNDELMPIWVKQKPTAMPIFPVEPRKAVSFLSGNSNNFSFKISSPENILVEPQKIFFPGWRASVDGKPIDIKIESPRGLMQIPVPKGDHIVHFYFQEDGVRLFSDLISISALLFALVLLKFRFVK